MKTETINPDYAIGKIRFLSSPKCFIGDLVLKYLRNKDRFPIESFGNDRYFSNALSGIIREVLISF
jgi:hypothetical protein